MLEKGQIAPDFSFKHVSGKEIKLSDLKGKKIILYFYPKDNTSGCTKEACNFRDNYEYLTKLGFEVIGVSPDDETSHNKFREKYNLNFTLVPDPEKKIINLYGVWGNKVRCGKESEGLLRTTFIIDENGIIQQVIKNVDTANSTQQILDILKIK
ncbi:MAG: thioredoxin-dependent thiol peroxidase [Bacteroidales bacterium]|jgi:peroxiredoxin Q/BCP|nr:thioredoxin-dependent thiol peroxidase [Bacteroidales bacterium]MDI9576006.1 thioredoxin-dependent thiol peroxidase [Bacteroidota bacterium]MDD2594000.1 thioredoxin-dependent thiol peroxidase [Bacteroidales bacterium]MDD3755523.1 thioredoxin-dependent thiol peroxidase [Bacteroidales bacterium]MDY0400690.1 thioredoxin-dependent thiol peroxidase [Bacteroidales bacterium]